MLNRRKAFMMERKIWKFLFNLFPKARNIKTKLPFIKLRMTKSRRLLFILIVIVMLVIYFMLGQDVIYEDHNEMRRLVDNTLEEYLLQDKGTGCDVPKLDPFANEVVQFCKPALPIVCAERDWVKCHMSKCKIVQEILNTMVDIKCFYVDIIYKNDGEYYFGSRTLVVGDNEYVLTKSDHVKIYCESKDLVSFVFGVQSRKTWSGYGVGFRNNVERITPLVGENAINVFIFAFDSTSKNGFMRNMPKSYKVLTQELKATVLNGYNIVGDGTPAALFPILTGKTELELPEARKSIKGSGHLDDMPFIFYKLKYVGYRTAYFEDMPSIGTFQYRFNGFLKQPADHYLRPLLMEESKWTGWLSWWTNYKSKLYCFGDTPTHKLMMNLTDQFFSLDGKKFSFTFISDICHDDFNMISNADNASAEFLRGLKAKGRLRDTLLIVMGDHGPRYANVRDTYQGKLEERLPLMAIRLPEVLKGRRPKVQSALNMNVDALTTPHDIYATILDALDMTRHWNPHKIKGADLPRGMTLLETVPGNRSCSEAGIEPHWCTCFSWEDMDLKDPLYERAANTLVNSINAITLSMRHKCALRTLTSIHWVLKRKVNKEMLLFQGAKDVDGYVGKFGRSSKIAKHIYQIKISVGPGKGVYEAVITHNVKDDTMRINPRDITRTNAYNSESSCISDTYPHLNMFCYCKNHQIEMKHQQFRISGFTTEFQ